MNNALDYRILLYNNMKMCRIETSVFHANPLLIKILTQEVFLLKNAKFRSTASRQNFQLKKERAAQTG